MKAGSFGVPDLRLGSIALFADPFLWQVSSYPKCLKLFWSSNREKVQQDPVPPEMQLT